MSTSAALVAPSRPYGNSRVVSTAVPQHHPHAITLQCVISLADNHRLPKTTKKAPYAESVPLIHLYVTIKHVQAANGP